MSIKEEFELQEVVRRPQELLPLRCVRVRSSPSCPEQRSARSHARNASGSAHPRTNQRAKGRLFDACDANMACSVAVCAERIVHRRAASLLPSALRRATPCSPPPYCARRQLPARPPGLPQA